MKSAVIQEEKPTSVNRSANKALENKSVQRLLINITYTALGLIISNSSVFGQFAPFGVAFVASVPYQSLLWGALGTIAGAFLFSGISGYRYIAAVLSAIALRWVFSEIDNFSKRRFFAPVIAFIPLISTGLIMSFAVGFEVSDIVKYLTESLLAATSSYFFTKTIVLCAGTKGIASLSQQELACLSMTGCIILLSFGRLSVAGLSVGRILAVLLVIICSRYGGIAGGCITGAATGVVFGLSMPQYSFLGAAYAFGGLLGGLMSSVGKIAVSISFLLSSIIVLLQATQTEQALTVFYEILIAASVFMLVPQSFTNGITALFTTPANDNKAEGLRQCVIMRLNYASKAISDVSDSVNAISKKLHTVYSPDKDNIYSKASERVCTSCGLKTYCWEKHEPLNDTDFDDINRLLSDKKTVTEEDIDNYYPKKCCKKQEMASAITDCYKLCAAYSVADKEITEVKSLVSDEFKGLSGILNDLSNEFKDYEYFDTECAERVSAVFKLEGFVPIDVACRVNKYNRMCIEVIISDNEKRQIKRSDLIKAVSGACGRKMDAPCVSYAPDRCRIQFNEKPVYDMQIGTSQHTSGNGTLCGDSFNYFTDGMGRFISVISDGMGTGGRAAVDGNMATGILTKLVKAGLSLDCSLNIVNSALIIKSDEESLATLDVSVFDMFTGNMEFLKAGAPMTYIKRGGNVIKIETPSLPAGILRNISFAKKEFNANVQDCIIMVSDGVISGGDAWLESKLKSLSDFDVKELAEKIIQDALARCSDRDDDMTVIVMRCVER